MKLRRPYRLSRNAKRLKRTEIAAGEIRDAVRMTRRPLLVPELGPEPIGKEGKQLVVATFRGAYHLVGPNLGTERIVNDLAAKSVHQKLIAEAGSERRVTDGHRLV